MAVTTGQAPSTDEQKVSALMTGVGRSLAEGRDDEAIRLRQEAAASQPAHPLAQHERARRLALGGKQRSAQTVPEQAAAAPRQARLGHPDSTPHGRGAGSRAIGAGTLVLALAFLAGAPSRAAGSLDGILACRRLADGSSRLACFDRESAALAHAAHSPVAALHEPHTAPSPVAAALTQPSRGDTAARGATLDPQQTFGLAPEKILAREEAARRLPPQLDHITAHVVFVSKTADGRDVFTLDNHEAWAQLVPGEDLYAKPGDVVRISRAMLGSYWLIVQSRRGGCKVTRLR